MEKEVVSIVENSSKFQYKEIEETFQVAEFEREEEYNPIGRR